MRRLYANEVQRQSVAALGLDPAKYAITSIETIAAALRRAAGFLCPCAASSLVRSVEGPLRGLVQEAQAIKTLVEDTLEQLIAHGDLFEFRDLSNVNSTSVILYAAPCGFISRASGSIILTGISADQLSAFPDLEARIEPNGCVRVIRPLPQERLRDDLLQLGLIEISYEKWSKAPSVCRASEHIAKVDQLLAARPSSGDIPNLLVLDWAAPVDFYRARWIGSSGASGRYVARRSQAYGAPLWCYVELANGQAKYLVDLPLRASQWRACDDAWHLQMAIDAHRGVPQEFRTRTTNPGTRDMLFYSPLPMWAQRRWAAVGQQIAPGGCLLAFRFPESEIDEECRFAVSSLWLAQAND